MKEAMWRRVTLRQTLVLSLLVHVAFLVVQCSQPEAERRMRAPLEVILVNAQSADNPKQAKVLAQVGLDGGGQADKGRATTLPSNAEDPVTQRELEAAKKRLAALEALQRELSGTIIRSPSTAQNVPKVEIDKEVPSDREGRDEQSQRALEMKRLQAQIAENIRAYNERPRKHFFSPKTSPYEFALYEEAWRNRVEQYGNTNYPPELKGRVYGKLRLTVYIKKDGTIDQIEIDRPSGSKVLDRAAVKLLQEAAPFSAFPSDIREKIDILAITRTWIFTKDKIRTEF